MTALSVLDSFAYSPWRRGGWRVDNIRWPNGGCGCVSRNYEDRKWRIVCDPRPFETQPTFKARAAAALGEWRLIQAKPPIWLPSNRKARPMCSPQLEYDDDADRDEAASQAVRAKTFHITPAEGDGDGRWYEIFVRSPIDRAALVGADPGEFEFGHRADDPSFILVHYDVASDSLDPSFGYEEGSDAYETERAIFDAFKGDLLAEAREGERLRTAPVSAILAEADAAMAQARATLAEARRPRAARARRLRVRARRLQNRILAHIHGG